MLTQTDSLQSLESAIQRCSVCSESRSVSLLDLVEYSQTPLVQVWQPVWLGNEFEWEQEGKLYWVHPTFVALTLFL